MKRKYRWVVLVVCLAGGLAAWRCGWPLWHAIYSRFTHKRTVRQAVATCRSAAMTRLGPWFEAAGVVFPPDAVALLAFKEERILELWANDGRGCRYVKSYAILGASGIPGPKLREGDRQVPEGIYSIVELNPNSVQHLSLKLNYPNDYDAARGREDGRRQLGFDIYLHGGSASAGCLAVGDRAIEELFIVAAMVGRNNIRVVIAPEDFRLFEYEAAVIPEIPWTRDLYRGIRNELEKYVHGAVYGPPGDERAGLSLTP